MCRKFIHLEKSEIWNMSFLFHNIILLVIVKKNLLLLSMKRSQQTEFFNHGPIYMYI